MAERLTPTPDGLRDHALWLWLQRGFDDEAVWRDLVPGPTVANIETRLSAVPRAFLAEGVDLRALSGDVLDGLAGQDELAAVARDAQGWQASRQGMALGLWLYASEDLLGPLGTPLRREHAGRMLGALALRLAAVVPPYRWLVEADRREEAARAVLLWSGQHPAEDYPTARSRWAALDSLRRDEALQAAMADYLHRQEVQRRLAEQRAREAAARYTPE